MDNEVLRLIKIITLLYLCGQSENKKDHIPEEIRKTLSHIKIDPRATQGVGSDENIIENLRDSAEWMLYAIDIKHSRDEILARLRINCRDNPEYMAIIEKTLMVEIIPERLDGRINSILGELRFLGKKDKVKKAIQLAHTKLNWSGEFIDMKPFLNDVISELSAINTGMEVEELPGLVGMVDFGDVTEISKALEKGVALNSPEGILNTGLIGLNEALGGYGIIRGWMYNVGAISFGYKTGHLLDLALNIPRFNIPWLWNPVKKPMIVRISVETTIDQDTKMLFQRAWWQLNGVKIPLNKIDIDVASAFLKDFFESKGYKFVLLHFNPNIFTVFDLIKVLDSFEAKGYEIHLCDFDYATKIAKHTPAPRDDIKLSLTYDIMRSYCYPKGITMATGAQLNSDARAIAQGNPSSCTKTFASGSMYENSKSIYSELDVEILSHVYKHPNGKSYWCASRGKHRDHDYTPLSKRDFYYEFEAGGIRPDFGETSRALYKLPNLNNSDDLNLWE